MKKQVFILLAALALVCMGMACAGAEILSAADLNDSGVKVGLSMGSAAEEAMREEAPKAAIEYYTDNFLGYTAVAQGKLDAYIYDLAQMERAIRGGQAGVRLLPETMRYTVKIVVGVSPVSHIPDLTEKVNQFIREAREAGTLDDMYQRWVLTDSPKMPVIELPENPQYQLVVGTTGTVPPYSYYEGDGLTGYDIELAYHFAAWLGAGLKFDLYDFGSIVPAAGAGKIDLAMSNLQYLPERSESGSMLFSDVLFEEKMGIMVRDGQAAQEQAGAASGYTALDQLDGKRIGVQTGTTAADIARGRLPNIEISYFSTFPDMAMALKTNKIDGFPGDGLVLKQMAREDPSLVVLDEMLRTYDCGFVLAKNEKGKALQAELNEWIGKMRESGELDRILIKWTEGPESEQTVPEYKSLPAPKGTLTMTTEGTFPPMNYYRGEECVGMEIELCALFCKDYGYGLNVTTMDFDGMLAAVQSGKVDFAISGIAITEERKESVLFSDPYYTGGTMMAVLKAQQPAAAETPSQTAAEETFWDGLQASFEKTFFREDRWRLFGEGVLNTLIITALSILCGTALGFGVFMLCRKGNPFANGATRFFMWLVQGTPMVVLLMILYYIIFGSVAISGILVAVIGFSLTFGSSVFGLLKMGVGAVDNGQYEAAYALGYSNRRTFFKIILPQALPHVLSAYKGEIVGLIKATAIVGYIAVQDLTKMGDIVRSRTYEAFFPLIAITVIYFVLEGLLGFLVSRIGVNANPKRRKPADILKGVKTDD